MSSTHLISLGAKLREARIQRGYSLDDITAIINVDRKYLDLIEQGVAPDLPAPYVRGIIRSYAKYVGVSHGELSDAGQLVTTEPSREAERPAGKRQESGDYAGEDPRGAQRNFIGLFAILATLVLAVSIFWMSREKDARPVRELSFAEAVKEQEARYAELERRSDSTSAVQAASGRVAARDSLTLEGRATDSLSVKIGIDRSGMREYLLPAGFTMRWRAGKFFLLTLDNPEALILTLNGVGLTGLTRSAKPLKNVTLSLATIVKLRGSVH